MRERRGIGPPAMTGERTRASTIIMSLASLPFIVPHVVEDFEHGIAQRVNLSTGAGAFLLGCFLAVQAFGLVLVGQGRRAGFLIALIVAAIWIIGALVEHGSTLAGGGHGETSIVWLLGVLLTQTGCLVLGWVGWRRAR